MTEKRFTHKEDDWEILDRNKHFAYAHSSYQAEKIIQELNELVETNRELYQENKQLKAHYNSLSHNNGLLHDECINKIDALKKENEQLKQRNNRQAKQLDRLYNLIEEKDWRTLTDILDDFKRCEEQLHKEWGTYGDVE